MKRTRFVSGTILAAIFTLLVGPTTAQLFAQGGTWATKSSMPTPRALLGTSVVNGVIYAVGGLNTGKPLATVEAYDPASDTWTTKTSMPTARYDVGISVVNGVIYAMGGYNFVSGWLGTVEAYDPASDAWTTKTPMPTARAGLSISVVNGVVYAIGGANSSGNLPTVEAYDPASETWTTETSMPTARNEFGTSVVNGVIYAVGGSNNGALGTVEAYNAASNTWTTKTPMPTPRYGLGTSVVNGIIYAVGGYNGNSIFGTVEAYDPASDTWTTISSMPTPRYGPATSVVNGVVYAIGGENNSAFLATVEAFTPTPTTATTTTLLTSSLNPASAGDSVTFTATVTSSSGTPTGSVTFFNGQTALSQVPLGSNAFLGGEVTQTGGPQPIVQNPPPNTATLNIGDADTLGAGNITITAQYTPDTTSFAASSARITQTVAMPGVALTNGNNTLSGNQAVNGTVTATAFSGDGSGLTNVTAAHATSADTATTATTANFATTAGTATTADTATNALSLGSILAINFARLDIGNAFNGNQTFNGGIILGSTGYINLPNADPNGSAEGWIVSGEHALMGFNADNSTLLNATSRPGGRVMVTTGGTERFPLMTILNTGQVGIGTTTPNASLEVNGTAIFDNTVTFAAGQTFPGAGTGTITGVTAGSGLSGGGASGNVTLNNTGALSFNGRAGAVIPTAGDYFFSQIGGSVGKSQLPTTIAYSDQANSFANTQTIAGGNLALDKTNGAGTAGVITVGGYPFLHNFGSGNTFLGLSAGNFTMTGSGNTASGTWALNANTTGVYNTVDGWGALIYNTTGLLNTALGAAAGQTLSGANANTTGSYNTFIGANSGPGVPSSTSLQNATAIGASAVVSANNALVLGSINGVNGASASVNVGIGTASPAQALDVVGNVKLEGSGNGVMFPDGTTQTTAASDGTITGVTAGSGLFGGGTTGNVSLSIPPAGVNNAMLANPSLNVNAGAGLTGGGSVALGGTTTLSLASAACNAGSAVTALPLTCSPFAGLGANSFLGSQTMPSLTVNGLITSQTGNFLAGVSGNNTSGGVGVYGTGGLGVEGISASGTGVLGVGSTGVYGNGNSGPGVYGISGISYGVFGATFSTSATVAAGVFINNAGNNAGNILIGKSNNVTMFSVDSKGDVAASGSVTIGSGGTAITKHLSLPVTPNFANQNSLSCESLPFTLTGAADGDTLALGIQNSMLNVDVPLVYTAWVSAPDTVTVRVCNFSGAKQKVAATGSIRIDLWKH